MRGFITRRVVQAVVIVFLVATITFLLVHLAPGDPVSAMIEDPRIGPEIRARWRAAYGLDRPLAEQYWRYLASVARGDFGWSFSLHRPVGAALADAIPNTLLLMGVALLGSFVVGVTLGIVQALRRGTATDRVVSGVSLFFYSMPDFWLALMALLLLAVRLHLFPAGGMVDPIIHDYLGPWGRLVDRLRHLVLPAATLTLLIAAGVARFQRAAMLDVVGEDFVRTARAKGVPERRVVLRHALRNALLPTITIFGLAFPALLGGSIFIEKVFSWPGMGLLAADAIAARDYALVTASVIVGGTMVAAGTLLADLLYAVVDPRLRER